MISIILVTYNRLHLLRKCVENVLFRTSDKTREIIIWNNGSTDGTKEYLDDLKEIRLKIVHHKTNIGTNAFARAFSLANSDSDYFIELDDDVIDAPYEWDRYLLDAFLKLPNMGFLAANVVDDGKSIAADVMYRRDKYLYECKNINGVNIMFGPTGGWCTMTSREIYGRVGGFKENPQFTFWHEDGAYVAALKKSGYSFGILKDLKVFHASGPYYSADENIRKEKEKYYTWRTKARRVQARKDMVKKLLNNIKLIRMLNNKYHFYHLEDNEE